MRACGLCSPAASSLPAWSSTPSCCVCGGGGGQGGCDLRGGQGQNSGDAFCLRGGEECLGALHSSQARPHHTLPTTSPHNPTHAELYVCLSSIWCRGRDAGSEHDQGEGREAQQGHRLASIHTLIEGVPRGGTLCGGRTQTHACCFVAPPPPPPRAFSALSPGLTLNHPYVHRHKSATLCFEARRAVHLTHNTTFI